MGRKRKTNKDKELDNLRGNFRDFGLSRSEQYYAHKRFDDYKDKYHLDSYSDLQLLEELVFREIIQNRYKKELGKKKKTKTGKDSVPSSHARKAFDDNLERMLILRDKLGLFSKEEKVDPYEYLKLLERKFEKHREENAGDYSCPCPMCKKMLFFTFKVKDYDVKSHPFFKGKFLGNDYLWKLYKEGKLSKEDLAKVFQTSQDYINWLEIHIYKNPSK